MFNRFEQVVRPHLPRIQALRLKNNPPAHLSAAGLSLDYAQQFLDASLLEAFNQFLDKERFRDRIEALFRGDKINVTENRAVLHPLLRDPHPPLYMQEEFQKMERLTQKLIHDKRFTDIVNIGIGGSDLGPRMVVRALRPDWQNPFHLHFVSNVDGTDLFETLEGLDPATTLFIVASKSFTTQETLMNAETAKAWLQKGLNQNDVSDHFIGITSQPEKAIQWGIPPEMIFAMWDAIGGRYSLWSAIGLPIMLAVGIANFKRLLQGAHAMDQHFRNAPWAQNMPVLLALIAVLNQNFLGACSHAVLPYDQTLELLPAYLQQVDMESNGKRVTLQNEPVTYQTGVVLWGSVGTNGQHAYHQLLHQGTLTIPIDLILPLAPRHPYLPHHRALVANCYGQKQAFLEGCDSDPPYKRLPGNRPVNLITLPELNPETLGALIALYEHKIFVQSLIWEINAFDQWGVELGKKLAETLLEQEAKK